MESLPQETQHSLSDDGLLQDVISVVSKDFTTLLDTDIGILFVAFYGFMALCCAVLLWYCAKEKGILRHTAFACVLLCIFFSGFVASLAILDLKQPRTIIERSAQKENIPTAFVTGSRSESLGHKEIPQVEVVITPQLEYTEIQKRRERGYDAEGNLLEDDLSHESSYPRYREE